jgi:hypothetical protein
MAISQKQVLGILKVREETDPNDIVLFSLKLQDTITHTVSKSALMYPTNVEGLAHCQAGSSVLAISIFKIKK